MKMSLQVCTDNAGSDQTVHLHNWVDELGHSLSTSTVKPVLSGHSKRRPKVGLQDK